MDESKAREILAKGHHGIYEVDTDFDGNYCYIEGSFTADELEAIAWWMRNKSKE